MPAPIARATRNIPSRLTPMTSRHVSRVMSSGSAKNAARSRVLVAALLCSTSGGPSRCSTSATIAVTAAGSATSQAMPAAGTPKVSVSSSASSPAPSPSRSTTATAAPWSASAWQNTRPRIPAAPVTTATRPVRSNRARTSPGPGVTSPPPTAAPAAGPPGPGARRSAPAARLPCASARRPGARYGPARRRRATRSRRP